MCSSYWYAYSVPNWRERRIVLYLLYILRRFCQGEGLSTLFMVAFHTRSSQLLSYKWSTLIELTKKISLGVLAQMQFTMGGPGTGGEAWLLGQRMQLQKRGKIGTKRCSNGFCKVQGASVTQKRPQIWFYRSVSDGSLCVFLPAMGQPREPVLEVWCGFVGQCSDGVVHYTQLEPGFHAPMPFQPASSLNAGSFASFGGKRMTQLAPL